MSSERSHGRKAIEVDEIPFRCDSCGDELTHRTCKDPDCMMYGVTYELGDGDE